MAETGRSQELAGHPVLLKGLAYGSERETLSQGNEVEDMRGRHDLLCLQHV